MANLYPSSRAETPVSPLLQTDFPLPPSSHSSVQLQRLSNRSDGFNIAHAPHFSSPGKNMSRSPSISSYSNTSVAWGKEPATPTNVHPPPAYIAPFGASQVVSETKRRFSDDGGDGGNGGSARSNRDDVQFSPAALALVNAFLDQLLYSMLATAKSTTLTALRPAVIEVLKSRLASDAISSAEEELAELLAGGEEEEEEMNQRQSVAERQRRWDTELVWKRTRLRVMVYIRLGEMEDDDEERYVREDELFHGGDRRFSHSTGLVSWAAAIFLTSVLEYVAEQVLQVAGQAADSRARRQSRSLRVTMSASGMVTPVDGVTVEDYDMEKVALNSTLGRLWRTWRKSLRNNSLGSNNNNGLPPTPTHTSNNFSRRLSRDHFGGAVMSPRRSSFGNGPESVSAVDDSRPASTSVDDRDGLENGVEELPEAQYPEHVLAANIPLPMEGDEKRDVDEIEVPGLARDPDEAEGHGSKTPVEPMHLRRKSLTGSAPLSFVASIVQSNAESDESNSAVSEMTPAQTALMRRQRSHSIPESFAPLAYPARDASVAVPTGVETVAATEAETDADPKKLPEAIEKESQIDEATTGEPAQNQDKDQSKVPASDEHPLDFSDLLGTAAANLTTAAAAAIAMMYGTSPQASASYKRFGGAAAGTAAAAAAAVALVYGNSLREKPSEQIAENAVEGAAVEKPATEAVDTPIEKQPERNLTDKKSMVDLIKSGQLEPPPEADEDHIEERDNQKQLVDKKRLSIPPANKRTSWNAERSISAEKVSPIEPKFSRDSPTPKAARSPKNSQESFALDDGSELQQPLARPRHLSGDFEAEYAADRSGDIGVARTSDTAVSTGELPQEEFYHARDSFTNPAPKRRSRIILTSTEEQPALTRQDSPPSPLEPEPQLGATTPASFLAKRSLTPKALPLEKVKTQNTTHEQSKSPVQPSSARTGPPAGLTVSTSHTPVPEKTPSPWRQSFSAAVKESTSWTPHSKKSASVSEPASAVPVQEHPVVFKMGSNKRDSRYKEDSDKNPLTSASIKGPEDFEMFVQGGDTVKYTLTPESVRGNPSPTEAVPRTKATSSRSTDKTPSSPKKQIPVPAIPVEDTRTGRSQASKQATAAADDNESTSSKREKRRSISRPPVRNTSVHRKSGLMAREPQVLTESTRDFADFIRSTGPSKEPDIRPLVSNRSSISLHSLAREPSIHTPRSHSPAASTRSMTRPVTQAADAPPVPPMPASASTNKSKNVNMLPRNAQINNADGTSELIDFIRTGPNGATASAAGEQRQHRISRTVAPFRTTMDSDQLQEWGDRIAVQPDLKLNTNVPVASIAPSVRSASSAKSSNRASANSRSALLQNSSTSTTTDNTHPAYADHPPRLTSAIPKTVQSSGDAVPKQRFRNKDPYAIDLSDEEDEDLLTALPKNRRQEESLIDFLRNSEPPETNNPRANANGIKSQSASAAIPPRRGSSQAATGGLKTFGADAVSMGRRGSATARDGPQVPPKTNAQRNGTTAIAVGPITKPRQKLEARNDGPKSANIGGTTDLADFLRSSGPPEPPTRPVDRDDPLRGAGMQMPSSNNMKRHISKTSISASTSSKRSLGGFFSSVFGSKRKQQSAGYLDM